MMNEEQNKMDQVAPQCQQGGPAIGHLPPTSLSEGWC